MNRIELAKQISTRSSFSYSEVYATLELLYISNKYDEALIRYKEDPATFMDWTAVALHLVLIDY